MVIFQIFFKLRNKIKAERLAVISEPCKGIKQSRMWRICRQSFTVKTHIKYAIRAKLGPCATGQAELCALADTLSCPVSKSLLSLGLIVSVHSRQGSQASVCSAAFTAMSLTRGENVVVSLWLSHVFFLFFFSFWYFFFIMFWFELIA